MPEGAFDELLEAAGGNNNGSTTTDRTNYFEDIPSHAVELALWLEADRMGGLLDAMDQTKLDLQREVVKNERRQSYENRPYGLAWERLGFALYPPSHPYHWSVIGSMEDLEAAELEDVDRFFRTYYAPNNASLAVAGDVDPEQVREWVERYFGEIPAGPPPPPIRLPDPTLASSVRIRLEDEVSLPRVYRSWHSAPGFSADDAALEIASMILTVGKSSRLHERLVYRDRLAGDVAAYQDGGRWAGSFHIIATARAGVSPDAIRDAVTEEVERLGREGPDEEEVLRAVRGATGDLIRSVERVGGFEGRADRLNEYFFFTGDPDFLARDFARFEAVTPDSVASVIRRHLLERHSVELSVVPRDAGGAGPALRSDTGSAIPEAADAPKAAGASTPEERP